MNQIAIIILFVAGGGCAHFQGRETVHGVSNARWCQSDAATYSFGSGLTDAEQVAFVVGSAAWNKAASSLPYPMVTVVLFSRTLGRGDIEISRTGGDWGTTLEVAPDGCITRARIEAGAELDQMTLARETKHELGHALGLAESVWPGDVMYNGSEITYSDALVATQRWVMPDSR